jgi:hypothetical protein
MPRFARRLLLPLKLFTTVQAIYSQRLAARPLWEGLAVSA